MAELPLTNVRVIEMTHMVMGPTCGMILAQLGAEVIKVEPMIGDKTRNLGGMGTSFFPLFNRGKKSITLDLKSEKGQQALHKLLATADVFLENFKDETIKKIGLDSKTLSQKYPRLIIGAHKGFLSGPYQDRPALDEVVQMMAGLAYMTGSRERPLRVGSSINDMMGGMFGVIGVLASLLERGITGKGQETRVGLFENCLLTVAQHMLQYEITSEAPPPMPERIHAWPIYDIFETSDGQRLFIGATTETNWVAFCREFGFDEFLDDPELQTVTDRIEARSRTLPIIAAKLKQQSIDVLEKRIEAIGLPFARINTPVDLYDDPHVLRPGGLVSVVNTDGQILRTPTLPLEIGGEALQDGLEVPQLGADSREILMGLGYSSDECDELLAHG